MANYTENKSGITFSNIDWSSAGHTLVDKARISGQGEGLQDNVLNPIDKQGNPITRTSFGIDAINIDWNGAQWPNSTEVPEPSTINSTGDLMKGVYSPMFAKAA